MPRRSPFALALAGAVLGALCAAGPAGAATEPPRLDAAWVAKWREDLDFARERFPEVHANLFHEMSRETFESEIDALSARLPELSQAQVAVELARIVAEIGDGHTRVSLPLAEGVGFRQGHSGTEPPKAPGLVFRQLPIRVERFEGELYVTAIGPEHAALAGSRVVRVGTMSVDEAMHAIAAIIHRDNEYGVDRWLTRYMVLAEVLYAVGVTRSPERTTWTLAAPDGRETEITLAPVPPGREVTWTHARDVSPDASPRWLARTDEYWWFEHLPETKTVYFQYNRVDDSDAEELGDFVTRLFAYVAANEVERLVIDLRHNDGGDNSLNRSLIHALIRSPFQERGSLYALIGSETFSAALMFCISLEKHTPVLFVGTPTGASPNDYGDSRKVQLPNSGLTVRLSTLYWQYSGPTDEREAVEPHIRVAPAFRDYAANRDPVLDYVLSLQEVSAEVAGAWDGAFLPAPAANYPVTVTFERAAAAWRAELDVAGTELQDVPMENVRVGGAQVAFDWRYGDSPMKIRGRIYEGSDGVRRLIADVHRSGRLGLMLLEAPTTP